MAEVQQVKKKVVCDIDHCIECKTCASACFYGHQFTPAVGYGEMPEVASPVICRQCEDAPCVAACPVEAMARDESGVVYRRRFLCIGCTSCVFACPFGVIDQNLTLHTVGKCDLCRDRLPEGLEPRCVTACPTNALRFAEYEDVEKDGLLVIGGRIAGRHPIKRR